MSHASSVPLTGTNSIITKCFMSHCFVVSYYFAAVSNSIIVLIDDTVKFPKANISIISLSFIEGLELRF